MAEPSEAGTVERRAFVAAVLAAVSERRGRLDVVVTLLADLLGEVGADPQLHAARTTTERALLLGTLDTEELTEAVAGPAARTGQALPPDAVALLVKEAEGQAGALPLLQFTLEKLWRAIDDAPTRPIAELLGDLGGVGGALANEAESLYRRLHPEPPKSPTYPEPPPIAAQVRARRVFSRLLQTRDGQVLGRRRQTRGSVRRRDVASRRAGGNGPRCRASRRTQPTCPAGMMTNEAQGCKTQSRGRRARRPNAEQVVGGSRR